jgi:hypothetical protein
MIVAATAATLMAKPSLAYSNATSPPSTPT